MDLEDGEEKSKEESDKKQPSSVALKESLTKKDEAEAQEGEEKKDADEQEVEEKQEDNKDEDVKIEDGDEGAKTESNETSGARKTSKSASENEELLEADVKKSDYSLMDSLTGFLYEDTDPLPILCGYFLKIMDQLLNKQKQRLLEYLLLEQKGKIFDGLVKHLQHHSLALLLIKLIEVQVLPDKREKVRNHFDQSDGSDFEEETADATELTSD